MIVVAIGFVSGSLLILTMGLLIRRGMTRLIAGYDPKLVRDEKGLANWVGSCLMVMGGINLLAGILVAVLPSEIAFIPVVLFVVTVLSGVVTIMSGLHRHVK